LNRVYSYYGKAHKVIDGDTVEIIVDVGFTISVRERFRLLGINAPEMKGPTAEAGEAARAFLASLIEGREITVASHGRDKYGRWLAVLLVDDVSDERVNVNQMMVAKGHAVRYMEDRIPKALGF